VRQNLAVKEKDNSRQEDGQADAVQEKLGGGGGSFRRAKGKTFVQKTNASAGDWENIHNVLENATRRRGRKKGSKRDEKGASGKGTKEHRHDLRF